jgi:hypothetical protein
LGLFLRGEVGDDPVAAANSPQGQEFSRGSVHAWAAVVESSGTASTEDIAAATTASLAQFAPDLDTSETGQLSDVNRLLSSPGGADRPRDIDR